MTQRNKKGQFKKGVSGNPKGRPKKRTEEQYLHATIAACTLSEWTDICKVAVKDALQGDKDARNFLANYLMGKPQQFIDHTTQGNKIENIIRVTLDDS